MKFPFFKGLHSRDKPRDSVSSAPSFYFGTSGAGKSVTVSTAMQMSTVYACVRVIAETIASLPLHVYEITDKGNMKATEHPLYRILHDAPNEEMTSFIMRETMLSHLLLWGNAYVQIIRSGRNRIIGLYPLMPDHMEVDRDSAGNLTYTYTTTEGRTVRLSQDDVLHISGLGFDGVMGYSPIALERNAIGLGLAAEEYGGKFFAHGARPSGVLTHPNTVKDPKRLRESWNAAYGGSANANKVCILEEGMTYAPISIPNSEAQFLETRKFQVEEICRIFRVPPHLVCNLDRATFSNIEHSSIDFAVHTIRPWLVRIEQAVNRALFSENEITKAVWKATPSPGRTAG
jgi:HK97 family phage portal protein